MCSRARNKIVRDSVIPINMEGTTLFLSFVYRFTGGINGRGWKGDIKVTHLAIDKLLSMGWKSRYTSDESEN